MEDIQACSLCGSSLQHYLDTRDHFNTGESFQLFSCPECQLLHTVPVPAPHEMGRYYDSEEYLSHNTDKRNFTSLLYRLIRNIAIRKKLTIISRFASEKSILDFGCGTGDFLRACRDSDWIINGMEPDQRARRIAEKTTGINLFESAQQIDGSYSVITLWHVLEHLPEPVAAINHLLDKLHPDGTLILALPNYHSPDAAYYKKYWAGFDVPRHLYHFPKQAVKKLASITGMKIVEIIPMVFDAYYVSLLSEKYIRPEEFPYLRAVRQGWISNRKASAETNHSSLIYVIKRENQTAF